jgi:hypothetical protein
MGSCRTSFFDLNLVRLAPNWNVGMSKIPPLRDGIMADRAGKEDGTSDLKGPEEPQVITGEH